MEITRNIRSPEMLWIKSNMRNMKCPIKIS